MFARRLGIIAPPRNELLLVVAAVAATGMIALAGAHAAGPTGLALPLAVALAVILLSRPLIAIGFVLMLTILVEGPSFGILTSASSLYEIGLKDVSLIDGFVVLAVASVGIDLLRRQRTLYVPGALKLPIMLLVLGMVAGVVVAHAAGVSLRFALTSEHAMAYLLFVPLAVANLDIDRAQLKRLLAALFALATFKALLGLIEVAGHLGSQIEGVATLSYYEPTANWLIMIAGLTVFAAILARARPPLVMLLAGLLLWACLLLSYRRSFWIGAVIGLLLLLMLASTPVGRRLLVPTGLAVLAGVWLLGSIHFQDQIPLVKRVSTLTPSELQANVQDRYRLNERANVVAEIREHPITGLGVTVPWAATAQTLSIETNSTGRNYVHFALLYYWLKLGILGLLAYVSLMVASMVLAWRAWRASREPLLRAFALASLAGIVGLLAIETTATFTGVDERFSLLLAFQLGLLSLLATTKRAPVEETVENGPEGLRLVTMVPATR